MTNFPYLLLSIRLFDFLTEKKKEACIFDIAHDPFKKWIACLEKKASITLAVRPSYIFFLIADKAIDWQCSHPEKVPAVEPNVFTP